MDSLQFELVKHSRQGHFDLFLFDVDFYSLLALSSPAHSILPALARLVDQKGHVDQHFATVRTTTRGLLLA